MLSRPSLLPGPKPKSDVLGPALTFTETQAEVLTCWVPPLASTLTKTEVLTLSGPLLPRPQPEF